MSDPQSTTKKRRQSILKRIQPVAEETAAAVSPAKTTIVRKERRVTISNTCEVKTFHGHEANLSDGSPLRQKINETMGSDGVFTPGRHTTVSTEANSTAHTNTLSTTNVEPVPMDMETTIVNENVPEADDTMAIFPPKLNVTAGDPSAAPTLHSPIGLDDTRFLFAKASNSSTTVLGTSMDDTMNAFASKGSKHNLTAMDITEEAIDPDATMNMFVRTPKMDASVNEKMDITVNPDDTINLFIKPTTAKIEQVTEITSSRNAVRINDNTILLSSDKSITNKTSMHESMVLEAQSSQEADDTMNAFSLKTENRNNLTVMDITEDVADHNATVNLFTNPDDTINLFSKASNPTIDLVSITPRTQAVPPALNGTVVLSSDKSGLVQTPAQDSVMEIVDEPMETVASETSEPVTSEASQPLMSMASQSDVTSEAEPVISEPSFLNQTKAVDCSARNMRMATDLCDLSTTQVCEQDRRSMCTANFETFIPVDVHRDGFKTPIPDVTVNETTRLYDSPITNRTITSENEVLPKEPVQPQTADIVTTASTSHIESDHNATLEITMDMAKRAEIASEIRAREADLELSGQKEQLEREVQMLRETLDSWGELDENELAEQERLEEENAQLEIDCLDAEIAFLQQEEIELANRTKELMSDMHVLNNMLETRNENRNRIMAVIRDFI